MSFLRTTVLCAGLLLAAGVAATEVDMAGGSVSFQTPDNWVGIMQVDGDPEVRVFQVPDPSPTADSSLARVTVTVKKAVDIADFQRYMGAATRKARQLSAYTPDGTAGAPNSARYTASEDGVRYSYSERYWFRDGHAIQLRCARPVESQAGAAWIEAFDHGCNTLAAQLKS